MKRDKSQEPQLPVLSQAVLEQERKMLLDLGNDITRVRDKNDLLVLFSKRLKRYFYFTHTIVTLIDEKSGTYTPFLLDNESSPIRKHPMYPELIQAHFRLNEPFIQTVLQADGPISFLLEDIMEQPESPVFLKVNYEKGVREILMTKIMMEDKPMGFIHMYTDKPGSFTNEFRSVINGIIPQLSGAVSNIIKNEEIHKTEREKSFLLDFSNEIAQVRSKTDLQAAIFKVLDKTMGTKLAMIRLLDDDEVHLSMFMCDPTLFGGTKATFEKMSGTRITVEEPYTSKVLASREGLVFNVAEEIRSGNDYAKLWATTGLKNMYSFPLRVGNRNIGTIWLLANKLSKLLLKGICAQISIAIANIQANEKLLAYKKQLEDENDYLKEQIRTIYNFSEIVGNGAAMQEVYRLISLVATSGTTVLVLGETGTGKELIARAIHNASPRKDKLMVKVNCAALPANLIESELFGHERGAFTGATDRHIGKFELANQSTLFLDEIGELPLEAQAKLLRVIQERELERVGGKQTIKVDVRLITATNRQLEEAVRKGQFREDLYYRLNVFPITLPPLRDRPEDIAPLANFFVKKYARNAGRKINQIAPKAMLQLRSYSWPGNVRELEHLIERSVLLSPDGVLKDVYLSSKNVSEQQSPAHLANRSLEEVERSYIIEVLKRCSGKISGIGGAAEILQVPGNTLHSKMKKLGITKADYFTQG
ncbi:sigma 54-interacting transcriptional regulator [Chitinophaga sp. G-6-1-13]|uniref:Sigma 54-interacting transcriptional regulator n=1 Tax=Chitinophaga fulva TaxID=2728842 RepID=A0A848GPS3_9BACT|nr:sigma 54-interacting transcriptional regulator [Chitinophaga fulva]NML39551.1 sigma 54-interacting transcriptional regulator [Chitinophaga fulva]